MKILITSYYELREQLLLAGQALEKLGCDIVSFPLMHKSQTDDKYFLNLKNKIKDESIDVVLWWFYCIPSWHMELICADTPAQHILFNWDDPYNWDQNDNRAKAKYFDKVFVTCRESLPLWKKYGAKEAYTLYPGFSTEHHYKSPIDHNYVCDISFCCTNLYENEERYPNQYIKRRELIDTIYHGQKEHGYKFNIYGPEHLKDKYPESYEGFIAYYDQHKVFSNSKINLCSHVLCNKDGYINERVFLVLACGGLLLVDPVKGIDQNFKDGESCVYLDKDNYLQQVKDILDNYDNYQQIKESGYNIVQQFNYDEWAKFIHNKL